MHVELKGEKLLKQQQYNQSALVSSLCCHGNLLAKRDESVTLTTHSHSEGHVDTLDMAFPSRSGIITQAARQCN